MCSTDGGATWNRPYMEPIKTAPYEFVFDMKQYRDRLLIYSQSDVYMVSKADLIEQTTSIKEVKNERVNAEGVASKKRERSGKSEKYDDAVYDLSGRKLNSSLQKKGIYIQNGKKVF